jgi:hypothetical protein
MPKARKLAAISLARGKGLDKDAARTALGANFTDDLWVDSDPRYHQPTTYMMGLARAMYPELATRSAAAAAPSVRPGVPIKIGDKGVFVTGTPEYEAAYRALGEEGKSAAASPKGKGRGRPRKMTPAIHAQKKLGKPRGGIRKKKALSLE